MQPHVLTNRTAQAVHDARLFVTDPSEAHRRPGRRLMAWAILKSARGQPVSQLSLRRLIDKQRAVEALASVSL